MIDGIIPEWALQWDEDFAPHCQEIAAIAAPYLQRPGAVYVDAGANTGNAARFVHAACPDARLILFEPVQQCVDVILARFLRCANVEVYALGLGEDHRYVDIEIRPANPGCNVIVHPEFDLDARGVIASVEIITLDSLHLNRIDFFKIDVEYHEAYLLRGAHDTIARCLPVIRIETLYETLGRWADRVEQFTWLLSLGYTTDIPYTDAINGMVDIMFYPPRCTA